MAGLLAMLLSTLAACHPGVTLQSRASAKWIEREGGLAFDSTLQARAEVARDSLLSKSTDPTVSIRVLESNAVLAYSWPNGEVFLTRKLIRVLDSEELAAVLAHELGHLEAGGHIHSFSSLAGTRAGSRSEEDADLRGYQLLEARGLSPTAMVRMLRTVKRFSDAPTSAALARRIDALEQARSRSR
jgi:Zn-dependent protease with chaperone function